VVLHVRLLRRQVIGSVLKPVSGLYLVDYRAERAVAAQRCDSVAGHVVGDTVSDLVLRVGSRFTVRDSGQ
jgi:hypothetical protein